MIVRPATVADAGGIALVHVRSWQAAYWGLLPQDFLDALDAARSERAVTRTIESGGVVIVAVDEADAVIGFVGTSASRDADASPTAGELTTIYVHPDGFGSGIGQALMVESIASMRAAGFESATLWVLEGNARARRFYEAGGWLSDGSTKTDSIGGIEVVEVRYFRQL